MEPPVAQVRVTVDEEVNREIYEREFREWLPERILDAHVHLVHRDSYPADYEPPPRSYQRLLANGSFTEEDCLEAAARILPGKDFRGLCFGSPGPEVNREHANRYVARVCEDERFCGLALVSPDDSAETVRRWIEEWGLLGYKPYHSLVRRKRAEEVSIPEMLPASQMQIADELGLVVMLHIPRARRLADPDNQREIVALAEAYPRAVIVLAHIGRAYYLSNVVGNLEEIRLRPNLYVDLAMLNHWEVLEYLFREFPRERILFGTDMPISCLGGKSVEINDQYAYIMEQDVRIGSSIYDAEHVVRFTYFYYEELRAIRKAAERAGLSRDELEALFYHNGMALLQRVSARRALGRGGGR